MHPQRWILIGALAAAAAYVWLIGGFIGVGGARDATAPAADAGAARATGVEVATFAGGCFWSTEAAFDGVPGVIDTTVGYTGGRIPHPSYSEVVAGGTGHAEALQIVFDTGVISYDALLDRYWRSIDPFVRHRQFCDVGSQYRPELFVHDDGQRAAAEASKARIARQFGRSPLVEITPARTFYPAEAYHQDYHRKNPAQYRFYRFACGRDRRLAELWGDEE